MIPPFESVYVPLGVLGLLMGSLVLHLIHLPYITDFENNLQTFLLGEIMFNFSARIFSEAGIFDGAVSSSISISYWLVVLITALLGCQSARKWYLSRVTPEDATTTISDKAQGE